MNMALMVYKKFGMILPVDSCLILCDYPRLMHKLWLYCVQSSFNQRRKQQGQFFNSVAMYIVFIFDIPGYFTRKQQIKMNNHALYFFLQKSRFLTNQMYVLCESFLQLAATFSMEFVKLSRLTILIDDSDTVEEYS